MLPKENRLTKKSDFETVRQSGKFTTGHDFVISHFNRKDTLPSRFGFIVSKKISLKAHVRNKVKRTLREIVRKNLKSVKVGHDFVILAKTPILHADRIKLESELKQNMKC